VVDEDKFDGGGPPTAELLTFPTPYPIKVVGRRNELQRAEVDAVVRAHAPDLEDSQISERESTQQHFIAITYTINAQSKEQIVALANALQAVKGVMMLI
jgi:uncharacterized protein